MVPPVIACLLACSSSLQTPCNASCPAACLGLSAVYRCGNSYSTSSTAASSQPPTSIPPFKFCDDIVIRFLLFLSVIWIASLGRVAYGHGFVHTVVIGDASYPGWNPFVDPCAFHVFVLIAVVLNCILSYASPFLAESFAKSQTIARLFRPNTHA